MFLLKNWWTNSPKKYWLLISVLLCSLLDFLTFEDVAERLSQNDGNELPLNTMHYPIRAQILCDDLVFRAFVWLCMVWLGDLYKNSKWPQYFSTKFHAKTSSCIRVNTVFHRNNCKNETQCHFFFLSGFVSLKLIMLSDRCGYKSCLFWIFFFKFFRNWSQFLSPHKKYYNH